MRQALLATTCLAVVGAACAPAAAAPSGLTVTSGQISVSNPNAQTTAIRQGSDKAILNWNSFSVGSGEAVAFQQPGSSSIALNRVTGGQASSILGNLTANGQVWLVNPNGVLFGRGAQVNVGGLIASTANILDSDFLAGNYNFGIASPNPNAGIVNQGTIQAAAGGSVVLAGAYVRNDGLIQANLGTVVAAGAKTFAVDFSGDKLLSFAVTTAVDQVPLDANGNPVTTLVSNTGAIAAEGGRVLLTARAAKSILDNVINTTGIVEANTASMVNGTVILDAGDGGVVAGGTINATGLNAGETGGTVKVLGGNVTVASGAAIDASGDAGGGTVLIGGNFHGAGPEPNAQTTIVEQGATISADAVTSGNGGQVAVWAAGRTAFNGTISAKGGALGGNGGFVETSGKQGLSVQTGSVNTLAANGQAGDWLLDPLNIVIQAGGSTTPITSDPFATNAAGTDTLDPSAISGAASNVTLEASNNVTFNTGVAMTNSGIGLGVKAGNNISFASGAGIITKGGAVTLSANDNTNGTATGNGGITLTDNGVSTTGKIAGTASLTAGSTNITVVNATGFVVGQAILGAGIPGGTTIASISGNTITLSNAATVSASDVFVRQVGGSINGAISLTTNGGTGAIGLGSAGLITAGGAITLNASSITSNGNAAGLSSAGFNAGGAASGTGGNISITTTSGGVTIGGGIITSGGFSSANVGGNSGSVTISSAGAVDIGAGLSLITNNSGASLTSAVQSINTTAGSPSNTSQTTGNAGAISVTGTSITLALGANAAGGSDSVSGSTSSGGNGAGITLTATSGDVTIGGGATGSTTGLVSRGGDSVGGSGGNGGFITVKGNAISIGGKLLSRGGDTFAASSGGNGGNITLTATGTTQGHSIRLYGTSDSPTDTSTSTLQADVTSRGGQRSITQQFTLTGTVTGSGGNITFQGANGGALPGDVFLQTSTASALNGGSTVSIAAGGGSSGGTVQINGSINAASANVESLRLTAGNGAANIAGGIGATTAINSLVLGTGISDLPSGSNAGAITINGPVTVGTQIRDLRGSGSLTFNGLINTPSLQMNTSGTSPSLAMNGGGIFSGNIETNDGATNPIKIGGSFTFTGSFTGNLSGNGPYFALSGPTSFDSSALSVPVVLSSIAGDSSVTLNPGSGSLTIGSLSSASGMKVSLRGSGIDKIGSISGPVSFDFSGMAPGAQVFAGGNLIFPTPANLTSSAPAATAAIAQALTAAVVPPPSLAPTAPLTTAPPPAPVAPAPVVTVTTAPGIAPIGSAAPATPSGNAPQTVEQTDTGGSMFAAISPAGPAPAPSSSGSTGSGSSNSTSSSSGTTSSSTSGSSGTTASGGENNETGTSSGPGTSSTSSSGTTTSGSSSSGPTSSGSATPATGGSRTTSGSPSAPTAGGSSAPSAPPPPPDASDRALSVIASPPPVRSVSHPLPAPPHVTAPVVPGFVNQVQSPPVPKPGTPGIRQNFSASGNAGRW